MIKVKKSLIQKIFGTTNFLVQQIFLRQKSKNIRYKIIWSKIFGSKEVFFQNKCWSTKIKNPKKLGPKIFVKIGSVTAEIMVTWTNVAGTYIS